MPTIYKPKRNYNKKREQSDLDRAKRIEIYNSSKWRKLRQSYLMGHPISEISEWENKVALTEHIHHILSPFEADEYNEKIKRAFDSNNLIAVTATEHWRLHHSDLRGCKTKEDIKNRVLELQSKENK